MRKTLLSARPDPRSDLRAPRERQLKAAAARFGLEALVDIEPQKVDQPLLLVMPDDVRSAKYPTGQDPHVATSTRKSVQLSTTLGPDGWYFVAPGKIPFSTYRIGDGVLEKRKRREGPWLLKVGNTYAGSKDELGGFIAELERTYR